MVSLAPLGRALEDDPKWGSVRLCRAPETLPILGQRGSTCEMRLQVEMDHVESQAPVKQALS